MSDISGFLDFWRSSIFKRWLVRSDLTLPWIPFTALDAILTFSYQLFLNIKNLSKRPNNQTSIPRSKLHSRDYIVKWKSWNLNETSMLKNIFFPFFLFQTNRLLTRKKTQRFKLFFRNKDERSHRFEFGFGKICKFRWRQNLVSINCKNSKNRKVSFFKFMKIYDKWARLKSRGNPII